jgi:hypothetical protein
LLLNPADTPDAYLDQLDSTVTSVLDVIAPIRRGDRASGKKAARWLEPEAVAIKQQRRILERRWKKDGKESDRLAY